MTEIMLGNIRVAAPVAETLKLWVLLWGAAGMGKTTLAATAPGKKLWLLFDPGGSDVLTGRDDIIVADFTGEDKSIVDKFKQEDPVGLGKLLAAHPDVTTVVFDSVTTFSELALNWAVAVTGGNVKIEAPSEAGYGRRNIFVAQMVMNVQRTVAKHGRNLIFIMHEKMEKDAAGVNVLTLMISAGQQNSIALRFGEVWWLTDTAKGRTIRVRPDRTHKPMKTRMFNPGDAQEFAWDYDPITNKGEGIATWFERWQANGGAKIPLPGTVKTVQPKK